MEWARAQRLKAAAGGVFAVWAVLFVCVLFVLPYTPDGSCEDRGLSTKGYGECHVISRMKQHPYISFGPLLVMGALLLASRRAWSPRDDERLRESALLRETRLELHGPDAVERESAEPGELDPPAEQS